MRKIKKIIIHCTATPLNTSVDSIRKYHLTLGYKDIGYHFIIDKYGFVHNGRPVVQIGAHCKGYNLDSIGVALIGGADGKFDFTFRQLTVLYNFCLKLQFQYKLGPHSIFGHNDFTKNKTCPNFNVKNFFGYESK